MNRLFSSKIIALSFLFTLPVLAEPSHSSSGNASSPATPSAGTNNSSTPTNATSAQDPIANTTSSLTNNSATNNASKTITMSVSELETLVQGSRETKTEEDPYRGHYVDVSAAIFGWLAVLFALIAVGLSLFGISKFRDLTRKVEKELKENVEREFRISLQTVIKDEITPKIKEISDTELLAALDQVKLRASQELKKVIEGLDSREALIDEVVAEIRNRLNPPLPLNQQEFEGNG